MKNNKKIIPPQDKVKTHVINNTSSDTSQENINWDLIRPDSSNNVDARNLHEFLGISKDFSSWIKSNLKKLDAIEGLEYSPKKGNIIGAGKPTIEYNISSEIAEHISMMSGSKRGKQVRTFYIELRKTVEKQNNSLPTITESNDPMIQLAIKVLKQEQEKQLLELQNSELTAKVNHYDSVILDMTSDIPLKTKRAKINEVIRYNMPQFGKRLTDEIKKTSEYKTYLFKCANYSKQRWNKLYHEFDYRFNKNIKTSSENRGMKPLDYAEQYNHLNDLYLLALELFEKNQSREITIL